MKKKLILWGILENNEVRVDPRYQYEYPELYGRPLKVKHTGLPISDCWVLLTVEDDAIVGILDTKPLSELLKADIIKETIKQNTINMAAEQRTKTASKYMKPNDLFINEMNWNLINATIDLQKYPLLIGPKGCGKTATAQAIAQSRGMRFYPLNCGAIFKPKQTLVGQMQAKDGTTFLLESEFLKHFTNDFPQENDGKQYNGVLIFLDEISRIPPAAANYFMTILDRIQSYIYVEEHGNRVEKGNDVSFIAAANFGYEYSDTRNLDGALMDRFIKFNIGYLPESEEVSLIMQRVPNVNQNDVKRLVKYATMLRKASETLRVAVSTRQLIDMAEYIALGFDLKTIFDNIFINLFINGSTDERETVQQMVNSNM